MRDLRPCNEKLNMVLFSLKFSDKILWIRKLTINQIRLYKISVFLNELYSKAFFCFEGWRYLCWIWHCMCLTFYLTWSMVSFCWPMATTFGAQSAFWQPTSPAWFGDTCGTGTRTITGHKDGSTTFLVGSLFPSGQSKGKFNQQSTCLKKHNVKKHNVNMTHFFLPPSQQYRDA